MDDIKIGIILAQIINFGVLIFLFKYFLGEKLLKLIHDRKRKLEMITNLEKDIEKKLQKAEENAANIVNEARKKAGMIEKDSMLLTTRNRVDMIAQAQKEADNILSSARREIKKERIAMLEEIKQKAIDLSLKLNEKVFGKKEVSKDFMEKEMENIEKN